MKTTNENFNWSCNYTWNVSAKNTLWCLLGCSIGDFGTILFFQLTKIPFEVIGIMILAIINGLITRGIHKGITKIITKGFMNGIINGFIKGFTKELLRKLLR